MSAGGGLQRIPSLHHEHRKHKGDYVADMVKKGAHVIRDANSSAISAAKSLSSKSKFFLVNHLPTHSERNDQLHELNAKYQVVEDFATVNHVAEASDILILLFKEKADQETVFQFLHSEPAWQVDPFDLVHRYAVFADCLCSSEELSQVIELTSEETKEKYHHVRKELMAQSEAMKSISYFSLDAVQEEFTKEKPHFSAQFVGIDGLIKQLKQMIQNKGDAREHSLRPNALVTLEKLKISLIAALDMAIVEIRNLPKEVSGSIFSKNTVAFAEEKHLACTDVAEVTMVERFNRDAELLSTVLKLNKETVVELFALLHRQFFGDNAATVALVDRLEYIAVLLRKAVVPKMTISICGEINTGKSTLIAAMMGENCLPLSADRNSCMPVRVVADSTVVEPYMLLHPAMVITLNSATHDIIDTARNLTAMGYPSDIYDEVGFPKDSREFYDYLRSMDVFTERPTFFREKTIGSKNIRESITLMNKVVSLVYCLKQSPRFAYRMAYVRPLQALLDAGREILYILPSIHVRCAPTEHIPFLGQLNFIDSPGLESSGGRDTFFHDVNKVMDRIFAVSNRIIMLTTPKSIGSSFFSHLRERVTKSFPSRGIVVINKFDFVGIDEKEHKNILEQFRDTLTKDGSLRRVDVQFLRARDFHDLQWCKIELARSGGFDKACSSIESLHALTGHTRKVLKNIFGADWEDRHLTLETCSQPGYKKTWSDFSTAIKKKEFETNFRNLLGFCVFPIFSRMAILPARRVIHHELSLLQNVHVKLMARLVLSKHSSESLPLLHAMEAIAQTTQRALKDISSIVEGEIEKKLIPAFHGVIQKNVSGMTAKARERLTALERSYPASVRQDHETKQSVVFTIIGFNGEEVVFELPREKTTISFSDYTQAMRESDKAQAIIEEILAASGIEVLIEKAREKVVSDAVNQACSALVQSIDAIWASHLMIDSENSSKKAEVFSELKASLLQEVEHISLTTEMKMCAMPTPRLAAGIEFVDEKSTTIFGQPKYHVFTQTFNHVLTAFVNHYYVPPAYSAYQAERGAAVQAAVVDLVKKKLNDIYVGVMNVVDVISASNRHQDDAVVLSKSMAELRSLIRRHEDVSTNLNFEAKKLDF